MSKESFEQCHNRITNKIRDKYNIHYLLIVGKGKPFLRPILGLSVDIELHSIRSYSPGKQNATKFLKLLVNLAKKHNVTIGLEACSYSLHYYRFGECTVIDVDRDRVRPHNWSTKREIEYYYWRALLMYQRVGFKPIYKESFINKIKDLEPVYLII